MAWLRQLPWTAITFGGVLTIFGIVLTSSATSGTENDSLTLIIGGILTTFGPVWVSHAIARELGRKDALEALIPHLNAISVNLGHSAGALSNALSSAAAEKESIETTLGLSGQALNGIKVQIDQLQKLIGRDFDGADLDATLQLLDDMRDKLQRAKDTNDEEGFQEASRGIQKIAVQLRKVPKEKIETPASCPKCGSSVIVMMGLGSGETGHKVCGQCGAGFNLHRDGKGALSTRLLTAGTVASRPASTSVPEVPQETSHIPSVVTTTLIATTANDKSEVGIANIGRKGSQLSLVCLVCKGEVKYRARAGGTASKRVICFSCDNAMSLTPAGVIVESMKFVRTLVRPSRKSQRSLIVECPTCGREKFCPVTLDGDRFGYCEDDHLVLCIQAADIQTFKTSGRPLEPSGTL